MKYIYMFCIALCFNALGDNRIIDFELNDRVVHTVYVYPKDKYPTTINFPGAVERIYGSGVATDIEDSSNSNDEDVVKSYDYIISHDRGASEFTLKSLKEIAENKGEGGVNIMFGGKTYVIDIEVAEVGYRSVSFVLPKPLPTSVESSLPATPQIIISQLEKVKAYHLIKKSQPEQVRDMPYRSFTHLKPVDHGDFTVKLLEAISQPRMDTIYFHVELQNKTHHRLYYDETQIAVNSGSKIWYSNFQDTPSEIPSGKGAVSRIWFAVTGNSRGEKQFLDPSNEWTIMIPVKDTAYSQAVINSKINEIDSNKIDKEEEVPKREDQNLRKVRTIRTFNVEQ